MFLMDGINKRIQTIVKELNLSIGECASQTGFSKNIVQAYHDDKLPSTEFLFALVEYLHVHPMFIFFNQEPFFLSDTEIATYKIE